MIIKSSGTKYCESCCAVTFRVRTYQYLKWSFMVSNAEVLTHSTNWYYSVLIDLMENPPVLRTKEALVTLADAIRY